MKLQSLTGHKQPSYLLLGSKMAPQSSPLYMYPSSKTCTGFPWHSYKVVCMCFQAMTGSGPSDLPELLHDVYIPPSCALNSFSASCMLKIQLYKCKTQSFGAFSSFGSYIIGTPSLLISGTAQHFRLSKQISKPSSFCNTCTQLKLRPVSFSSSVCVVLGIKVCIEGLIHVNSFMTGCACDVCWFLD